jgi:predicted branched-subunit amino acid permease|tara:strand:- start:418 stop:702 length:285 start_codon:yes stop_codon:yes gene_type:complete
MVKRGNSDKIIELEIKKSDIRREKSKLVLDKCIWLYFLFMIIGVLGFIYGYVNTKMLNFMIVASFIILIIGTLPYVRTISQEEKLIDEMIKKLK